MPRVKIKTQNFDEVRGVRFYREKDLSPMVEFDGVRATADPSKPGVLITSRMDLGQFMRISGQVLKGMLAEREELAKKGRSLDDMFQIHGLESGVSINESSAN